jgi:hypothetical protein
VYLHYQNLHYGWRKSVSLMNKKILLIDVDSTIQNIALMKLSKYYKSLGDSVELMRLCIPIYRPTKKPTLIDCKGYDKVHISAIFKGTLTNLEFANSVFDIGGSGIDLKKKLPEDIESLDCDYTLYQGYGLDEDIAYGFISRGCIRNCSFCIVRQKEGDLHQVNTINKVIQGKKKVKFFDNNFLALPNHIELLQELIKKNIKCQFNQGLDLRLINHANANLISKLNHLGEIYFAFDDWKNLPIIKEKMKIIREYIKNEWKIKMFLYCNPAMDIATEVYPRIMWCRNNYVLPYFMRDLACWSAPNKGDYADLSCWCNQPRVFKPMTYEQFFDTRHPNKAGQYPEWYNRVNKNDVYADDPEEQY